MAPEEEDGASSRTVSEDEAEPDPEPITSFPSDQSQGQTVDLFKETQIDPGLAEWLMVDETQSTQRRQLPLDDDSETEPEPDSDNDDVQDEDVNIEDDDWLNVPSTRSATFNTEEDPNRQVSIFSSVKRIYVSILKWSL